MLKLIWFVQTVFFLVSMLLTGLFAMSLSGADFNGVMKTSESDQAIFMPGLFILIGCCIDVGKYLFWVKRRISRYFKMLSLVLMVFSWLASCAFFLSSEMRLVKEMQQRSPEYVSLQQEIDGLQKNIAIEEQLLNKRLGSNYHRQWEQAQNSAARIERFQAEIAAKQSTLAQVGLSSSLNQLETTKLFTAISHTLNIDLDTARTVGYAVLALLLEVSTLGMISLAGAERETNGFLLSHPAEHEPLLDGDPVIDADCRQKLAQLTLDILNGKIRPVLRVIKSADYDLSLDQIRAVLRDLHSAGILDTDIRNSYKLSERVAHSF
tara:strand:- start:3519 stop:4484 length:966 start_codon:yes stop_codon:yes gene_type:complete